MSTSHLNGPELTVMLAALGLILNASVALYLNTRKRYKRTLARNMVRSKRLKNARQENFYEQT